MNRYQCRLMAIVVAVLSLGLLGGCASMGNNGDPRDPFEGFNRGSYKFNQGMDKAVFHPIASFYQTLTPDFVDEGISNFFSNINDVVVIVNDLLQFKLNQAISDLTRFVFNSTLGLAGFLDVSSQMGLPKHNEDFGQTLARWGFGPGPYLVVPFLGPSTIRDAAGYGLDSAMLSPVAYVPVAAHQAGLLSMNYIDYKADAQGTGTLVSEASLDEYEFIKSAYFDRRDNLVQDRESGAEEFEEFEDSATAPESP